MLESIQVPPGASPVEHAVLAGDDVGDGAGRRQAGEDACPSAAATSRGESAQAAPSATSCRRRLGVAVVHGQREAGGEEVRRQGPAEVAEPDEAEAPLLARG